MYPSNRVSLLGAGNETISSEVEFLRIGWQEKSVNMWLWPHVPQTNTGARVE